MNLLYSKMLEQADPSQVAGLARFFKTGPGEYGEGDQFLGIKVPVTRAVVKDCWKEVSWADLEECVTSEYHEVRLAALLCLVEIYKHSNFPKIQRAQMPLLYLQRPTASEKLFFRTVPEKPISPKPSQTQRTEVQQTCVEFYLAHTEYINNWDLVDLSCYPLLGEWLLDKDRTLLYELAKDGKTLWEQRIGMVSTMTFIRHGQLEDTFRIADILLHHPHDLIHKAVGWLLREAGKRDKAALEAYLQGASTGPTASENYFSGRYPKSQFPEAIANPAHAEAPRYRTMPRTMLRYAIEKFPEEERQHYLAKEPAK